MYTHDGIILKSDTGCMVIHVHVYMQVSWGRLTDQWVVNEQIMSISIQCLLVISGIFNFISLHIHCCIL